MIGALAKLGLPADDVLSAFRLSGPGERLRVVSALDRLREAAREEPILLEAKRLPGKLQLIKKAYQDQLTAILAELQQGEIDRKEFAKQAKPVIADGFRRAYEAGVKRPLGEGDEEWLRRAVDAEMGHAAGLAKQVEEGGVKDVEFRAGSYAAGLDGVAWNAMVEELPDGAVIHWKLGQAEHCDSCILLAAHSPYDKWSLPTTPKSGDTECRMNCKCRLVFDTSGAEEPRTGVFSIPGQLDDSLPAPTQGKTLADWLRPPQPPAGLSLPEGRDRANLDAIAAEMNYWRRLMAQLDEVEEPEEFLAAAGARKDANSRYIEYLEKRDLWDAPALSVDEVISGRELPLSVEREIFEEGISGEMLNETELREVNRLIDRYNISVGKKFTKGD